MKNLVHGFGINDVDSPTRNSITGFVCPYYVRWVGLIQRCYSEVWLKRQPSYEGCSVHEDWKYFSNFKTWMMNQDWEGKALDKDLLILGNKMYGPDTCVFVEQVVNNFTTERKSAQGQYMLGVYWYKPKSCFKAQVNNPFTGKREHLGYFDTELEAHLAWKSRKHELAVLLSNSEYVTDERVAQALRTRYL